MWNIIRRLLLVTIGAVLMAVNINTFVHAGGLVPGGFTGLSLLIKEIFLKYGGIHVPYSIISFALNAAPAIASYFYIGKYFTLYSILMIFLTGIFTDMIPLVFTFTLPLNDVLLCAIFGGILNSISVSLCLHANATSGGSDFIAIFISEKFKKDAWNYILLGNCVILGIAAYLFALDVALYSIIFQFTSTMALGRLYRAYQQKTLLIITDKPNEVYSLIRDETNHDATSFAGIGLYENAARIMLYSVISSNQSGKLIRNIKKVDPGAFINVLSTEHINGKFFKQPKN